MRKKLSSNFTFLYKYLFIIIWSGGFGIGTVALFAQNAPDKIAFLLAWLVGTLFIFVFTRNLKKVEIIDSNLIISNYLKSIEVPFSSVSSITENRLLNIHPITIHLNQETDFGKKIVFMPKYRPYIPFTSHPVYKELRELTDKTTQLIINGDDEQF